MAEPRSGRPYMPGYGIRPEPEGMLPWSIALERLTASHDYWLTTARPDGRPHVMPVWGAWVDQGLWFSTDQESRKSRNLQADPRCSAATDDARQPVIVDGVAAMVTDRSDLVRFTDVLRAKYASEWLDELYTVDFFDGSLGGGATYRPSPCSVFALDSDQFTTSPTRWTFSP